MFPRAHHERSAPRSHIPLPRLELIDCEHAHPIHQIHRVEQAVRNRLLSAPHLWFSNLVIRRIPDGVCLQGRVETDSLSPDVCSLVRQVDGVAHILNRLTVEEHQAVV